MSLFEIASRFGWTGLARFAGLVVLFLVLQVIRCPLSALVTLLVLAMRAIDRAVSARVAAPIPPARPKWRTG